MLYPVPFFRLLGVVPSVQRAHQIARNAAHPFERLALHMIGQLHVLLVDHVDIQPLQLLAVLFQSALLISGNFFFAWTRSASA